MKSKIIGWWCVVLSCVATVQGAVVTWTNVAGGSWQTAANWSPNQVPGASDTAQITTSGDYTITLSADATVTSFTLGGASGAQTITLATRTLKATTLGTVTAHGAIDFQSGGLQGNVTVASGGLLTFSGTGNKAMYSLNLVNSGTVRWTGGLLQLGSTPTTTITNDGLWEINSDASIYQGIGGPDPQFINTGTIRKIGGAQTTSFQSIHFENTGTVDAQSGTIQFQSGQDSKLGGTFTTAAGTTIQLNGGSYIENGASFTGGGTMRFSSGSLTLVNDKINGLTLFGGDVKLSPTFQSAGAITDLTLSGSRLVGTNEIAGTLTLIDGGVTGMLTVRAGGTMIITSTANKSLYSATLINNGTVTWNGGLLQLGSTPTTQITNAGLWDMTGNDSIYQGIGGPTPVFANSGTVRKSAGTGNSVFQSMQFVNTGTVEAQTGTIQFSSMVNMSVGGTFTTAANANVQLVGGTFTENGGVFGGAGKSRMTGGTLTLVTNKLPGLSLDGGNVYTEPTFQASGAITDLTINGAILRGTNSVAGTLTLTDGGLTEQLTVNEGGTLVFQGSTSKSMYSLTLTNLGTVQWKGGLLQVGSTPATKIVNSAIWEISGDDSFYQGIGGPTNVFVNTGTVRKISGSGNTSFQNIQFINSGTVDVQTGTISFTGMQNMILGGTFTAQPGAALTLGGGTYTANGATFGGGGTLRMSNGTLTLVADVLPGLNLTGGTVLLAPTFQDGGSITNMTLSGATLTGTNNVTGALTMLDGSINGKLTIASGATLVLSGTGSKAFYSLTLINNGTVRWVGGNLQVGATPTTIITNAGLWQIEGNDQLYQGIGGPAPQFYNTGTLRKSGGNGNSAFSNIYFANSGTVDVQIGTFSISSSVDASLGGTFTTSTGAAFNLANGQFTENGAVFSGDGSSRLNGGTLTLVNDKMNGLVLAGGDVKLAATFQNAGAITNLTLSGSRLIGTNEVSGTLTVEAGGISGQLTVRAAATLAFPTATAKSLTQLHLINLGTVLWQGGLLQVGATPTSVIDNAGLWDCKGDDQLYQAIGGPSPAFNNTGTLRKSGGSGTTTFSSTQFVNAGLVEAQTGTIAFNSIDQMTTGGTFTAAAGATIQLGSGNFTENGGVFSGPGTLRMTGGTLTLVNDKLPGLSLNGGTIKIQNTFQSGGAITDLAINGATLTGTNEIAGTLTMVDGGVEGLLTVRNGGTLALNGTATKSFFRTTLRNNGTIRWNGGALGFGATPTTLVENNGIWEINSDAQVYQAVGGPEPSIVNNGTVRKIGGSGATIISNLHFDNFGMVEAQSGTFRFPFNYTNETGALRLSGGRIEAQSLLTFNSGMLDGSGTLGNTLFNGGTISPGVNGPGQITFASGLKLTTGVTVLIDAQTTTPGTGHDQLVVQGATDLGGATLQVTSALPMLVGARLTIIDNDSADPVIGTFGLKPEGNLFQVGTQLFRIRYATGTGNDVVLIRDDGGVRLTAIRFLNGTFQLSGLGTNNGVYTIFGSADFTNWTELGTTTANGGGLFQFSDTNGGSFSNRFYQSLGPGIDVQ